MRRISETNIGGVDQFTKLYLPMIGVNDSVTIPDKSMFGHTITCSGNAKLSTAVSRNNGSSCSFDGTNSYFTYDSTAITLGTLNSVIAIDFWVYFNADVTLLINNIGGATTNYTVGGFTFYYYPTAGFTFGRYAGGDQSGDYARVDTAWHPTLNIWYHFAFVWNADGTANFYRNGIAIELNKTTVHDGLGWGNAPIFKVGAGDGNTYFNGYISDLRISDGTNRGWTTPTIQIDSPNMSVTTGKDIVEYTKLWIPGYGANGATDIKDRSAFGKTITNTNVTVSTTASKFNGSSLYFNGTSSKLELATNSDFVFAGDYTVSLWYYPITNSGVARGVIIGHIKGGAWSDISWVITHETNGTMLFQASNNGGSGITLATSALTLNTWNYLLVSRSGNTTSFYVNGTRSDTTTTTYTVLAFGAGETLKLGTGYSAGGWDNSYMSDVTIVNGSALGIIGTTCPVPSKPFSLRGLPQRSYTPVQYDGVADGIDKYTKLYLPLSEAGNAFTDKSFYGRTVTNTSVTSSTTQSKFGGSSANFNGSSSYLSIPDSDDLYFSNKIGIISFWVYPVSNNGVAIFEYRTDDNNTYECYMAGGGSGKLWWAMYSGSNPWDFKSDAAIPTDQWTYIALVATGTNQYIYINGTRQTEYGSVTGTFVNPTGTFDIGRSVRHSQWMNGYISQFKVIKDTINGWTGSTIPVPTRPAQIPQRIATRDMQSGVSTVANPVLYLKGDSYTDSNTVICDSSPYARTVTNTSVVTRTINQKYGPSSLYFNGSAYLSVPTSTDLSFGIDDFVISCWACFTGSPTNEALVSRRDDNTNFWQFYYQSGQLIFNAKVSDSYIVAIETTFTASAGVWYPIALVRSASVINIYVNGAALTKTTDTTPGANIPNYTSAVCVGRINNVGGYEFTGYMDEVLIVKGSNLGYTGATITVPQGPYKFR